ncbi:MAG: DUF4097 domain-containing protein [Clostridia bacterium]|nr:DUF4097 domain-containing protein [Clostridia bacterium]
MRTKTKIWLITAAALILIGMILFSVAMSVYHWDFSKLDTQKYKTTTLDIHEDFNNIEITVDTEDIRLVASSDDTCRVVSKSPEKVKCSAEVKNGTLAVKSTDTRKWYEHIGFYLNTSEITVYLPKTEYAALKIKGSTGEVKIPQTYRFASADISLETGDISFEAASNKVKIKTSTGDIGIRQIAADTLDLSTSTGTVKLADVSCQNIRSKSNTGDVTLKNVTASKKISVTLDTGDVVFDDADAEEIYVKTDTGDITGTLLREKVFITKTSTGTINVPKSTTGGRCELITSTGDISIKLADR